MKDKYFTTLIGIQVLNIIDYFISLFMVDKYGLNEELNPIMKYFYSQVTLISFGFKIFVVFIGSYLIYYNIKKYEGHWLGKVSKICLVLFLVILSLVLIYNIYSINLLGGF